MCGYRAGSRALSQCGGLSIVHTVRPVAAAGRACIHRPIHACIPCANYVERVAWTTPHPEMIRVAWARP